MGTPELRFRRADPSDMPELLEIAQEAAEALPYDVPWDEESGERYVEQYLGPEKWAYVLDDGDMIHAVFGVARGAYWFNANKSFARIDFLFVRPNSRRRDVSKHLMRWLNQLTAKTDVQFGFDSGGRIEAKDRFFRRFRFERTGYNYMAKRT